MNLSFQPYLGNDNSISNGQRLDEKLLFVRKKQKLAKA